MKILKYMCLYGVIASLIISAMEPPLPKRVLEQKERIESTKKLRTPVESKSNFENLPSELKMHIAHFIDAPTIQEALQKVKAYLTANRELRAFYNDELFIKNLLLELQKRFHISLLELTRMLASPISKKIAQDLIQEGEKSWRVYVDQNRHDFSYAEFIFKTQKDAQNIPSLLYYVYSNPAYFERACALWTPESFIYWTVIPDTTNKNLKYWIESGILNQGQHAKNLWKSILSIGTLEKPQSVTDAQMLIDAGYINIILDSSDIHFTTQNVSRLKPSIYDRVINLTNLYMDQMGTKSQQEIINLNLILRMLIKAGAKSSYELQQL